MGAARAAPARKPLGTAFGGFTVKLQLNGADTTTFYGSAYTGTKTITFSGPANSPSGAAPTYPATLSFTNGLATVPASSVTLTNAASTTLTAADNTVSPSVTGTSASFTVNPGAAARLAWTLVSVSAGNLSSPCAFTCTGTALGNQGTFIANVSVTDANGNTVSGLGSGHSVSVTTPSSGAGSGGSFAAPSSGTTVSLAISATGAADSTQQFTFKAQNGSWTSDTFSTQTTAGTVYAAATATVTKQ